MATLRVGAGITFDGILGNINTVGVCTFASVKGVTSINSGQLGGSRNIIINGSMVVNQRGFTGTAGTTASEAYTTDRFILGHDNDGVVSAGQTTMNSTVGGNAYADGFNSALHFRVTTADASLAASQYQVIRQRIEGYNVQGIKKGTANAQAVTLSFWVRSTTTGTYIAELEDADNARQVSKSYTIDTANTWEKKTLTYPADTTGVFDNDNGLSLSLNWWLAAGSTFSGGTLGTTWHTTTANRAVGQVNFLATAGNDFFLTGVQLEVGSQATEFERRSFGDELRLCQRYYEKSYAINTKPGSVTTAATAVVVFPGAYATYFVCPFQVSKRTTPTMTGYSPSSGASGYQSQNMTTDVALTGWVNGGFNSATAYTASAPNTSNYLHFTAEAEL